MSMQELNPKYCQTRIYERRGLIWHQCEKKVKIKVGGKNYCAIHSPEAKKKKEEKYWQKVKIREDYETKMKTINAIKHLEAKGYKIISPNKK